MVGSKAITYKGMYEVNWSFVISSEEQRYLADVIITH